MSISTYNKNFSDAQLVNVTEPVIHRFALLGTFTYPAHRNLPCDPFRDLKFSDPTRLFSLWNQVVNAHHIPLNNSRNLKFCLSSHPRIQVECSATDNARSIHLLTALLFCNKVTHMIDLTNERDQNLESQHVTPYCPSVGEKTTITNDTTELTIENYGSPRGTLSGAANVSLCLATLYQDGKALYAHAFNYHKFADWNDNEGTAIHKITKFALMLTTLKDAAINIHCRAGVGRSGSLLTLTIALLDMTETPTPWKKPATRINRLATILAYLRTHRSMDVVQNAIQLATIERCADCVMYTTDFIEVFEDTNASWEVFKHLNNKAIVVKSTQVNPLNPKDTGLTLLVRDSEQTIERPILYDPDVERYHLRLSDKLSNFRFQNYREMHTVLKLWKPSMTPALELYSREEFLKTCSAQDTRTPLFTGTFRRNLAPYTQLFQDSRSTFFIRETRDVAVPSQDTTGYALVFKRDRQLECALIQPYSGPLGFTYYIDIQQPPLTFSTLEELSAKMGMLLSRQATQFTPRMCLDMITYTPFPDMQTSPLN